MKTLLTGATGLIGKELGKKLASLDHSLVVLTRNPKRARLHLPFQAQIFPWNPVQELPPLEAYHEVEAIFHLAGESVAQGRWFNKRKREIRNSRVLGTRNLLEGARKFRSQILKKIIFASAVGFYGDRKNELLTEESKPGSGFLAEVCQLEF